MCSRAQDICSSTTASSGIALGDAGDPLFPEDEAGEARVSGVGMDHGECMAMRPIVGGGTRACGGGGGILGGHVLECCVHGN